MNTMGSLNDIPYLKYSFVSYLLLGVTDTIHHLHAALALDQQEAMHAVLIGIVLIPFAILMVFLFLKLKKKMLLWCFLAVAILAIVLPGLYHGGWDHLVKILAYLRVDGESTHIRNLLPLNNMNLWFYEITGILEFFLAVISTYFVYKILLVSTDHS